MTIRPILLTLALAASGVGLTSAAQPTPTTQPVHDRDPWIFRCVLDGNARMVVVSLGNHYWAAYDAAHCALAKVWEGDVELTGAVYDMRHGPQPKAKGKVLLDRVSPVMRSMPQTESEESSFPLLEGAGKDAASAAATKPAFDLSPFRFAYRGYGTAGGTATFKFQHDGGKYAGNEATLEETPSLAMSADGKAVFRRALKASFNPPNGVQPVSIIAVLPTSSSVATIRLVSGKVHVGAGLDGVITKAPAEIPFTPEKPVQIEIESAGEVIIDTEFKPADQQPPNVAK